ncbi:MAG: erythromycin esterase family protein [Bacteroidota bacterium]
MTPRLTFREAIWLLFLLPLINACQKDCSDPATCHTYQDNICEEAKTENVPVVSALETKIYPLSGSAPNLPSQELAGLDAIFEKAYFVGLGEATHGTLEFFEMKDRLFRYLVEKHGYKAIGFEATWGGALHVNRYVVDGIGTARDAVSKLQFWTWRTEEVVTLVEWMHDYNLDKSEEDKIYFYGFDVQSGSEEVLLIEDYLNRNAPNLTAEVVPKIEGLVETVGRDWQSYRALPASQKEGFRTGIAEAETTFVNNETTLVGASSQREFDLVKHAFTILRQYEEVVNSPQQNFPRDVYMASNSEWIRNYLGGEAKVALWAHNFHVGKGIPQLQGNELDLRHGDAYQVVGFSFAKGAFQAVRPGVGVTPFNRINEANCLTTNALLEEVGEEQCYIIFDELDTESIANEYFNSSQPFFSLGALFDPNTPHRYVYPDPLAVRFDVLIHFNDTNAAVPY